MHEVMQLPGRLFAVVVVLAQPATKDRVPHSLRLIAMNGNVKSLPLLSLLLRLSALFNSLHKKCHSAGRGALCLSNGETCFYTHTVSRPVPAATQCHR